MPCGRLLLALLIGGCIATSAHARTVDTAGATQCDAVGYATDRDPKGSNIRSAPRGDAPVIGHLQPLEYPGHQKSTGVLVGQTFKIIGSKGGGLLIRDVEPMYDRQNKPFGAFAGPGWVSGRHVGLQLGAETLRSAPSHEAPVIARLRGDTWGPDSVIISVVHACQDKYVEVTGTPIGGKPMHGWSWNPCALQLTTCDSGDGDDIAEAVMAPEDARTRCAAQQEKPCSVGAFARIGTVAGRDFFYARYDFADSLPYARIVIFGQARSGKLEQIVRSSDDPAYSYGEPRIFHTQGRILLHIPASESGTGNFNRETLYRWEEGGWHPVDVTSWLDELPRLLPKDLGVWKGVYPNYRTMRAETPLWRKQDGNACPSGGRAALTLHWRGDRLAVSSVRLMPAGDCGEPLPARRQAGSPR